MLSGDYNMFDDEDADKTSLRGRESNDDLLNIVKEVTETVNDEEKDKNAKKPSTASKIKKGAEKGKQISRTFLTYLAKKLYKISRHYIYVLRVLAEERGLLKKSPEFDRYLDGHFHSYEVDVPSVMSRQRLL
jgi:hypothetical protein